jgi:hypothetical protein
MGTAYSYPFAAPWMEGMEIAAAIGGCEEIAEEEDLIQEGQLGQQATGSSKPGAAVSSCSIQSANR